MAQAATKELAELQGTWKLLTHEEQGRVLPPDDTQRLTIAGDKITWKRMGEVIEEGTIALVATRSPKHLNYQFDSGRSDQTIFIRVGDYFIQCGRRDGKTRPSEFATGTPNGGEYLIVLKHEKEQAAEFGTEQENANDKEGSRFRFLAACLSKRIDELDKGDVPLPFLLETVATLAEPPGANNDPSRKIKILIDMDEYDRETQGMFEPTKKSISLQEKLIGARVQSVLEIICDQIDGVAFVRNDYISIVPRDAALHELNIQIAEDQRLPRLIYQFITKKPLEKALQQIAAHSNANIALAPGLEAKGAILITARLVNIPVDAAVEVLADMAGLKVVRRANAYLVTTKEQAAEIEAEQKKATNEKKPKMPLIEDHLPRKQRRGPFGPSVSTGSTVQFCRGGGICSSFR